ncbi:MAG: hypothetical protein WB586_00870 [Chthoniobacterales bacterium]
MKSIVRYALCVFLSFAAAAFAAVLIFRVVVGITAVWEPPIYFNIRKNLIGFYWHTILPIALWRFRAPGLGRFRVGLPDISIRAYRRHPWCDTSRCFV